MFYYISGNLAYANPTTAVIDAGGVGYKLTISENTYNSLPPRHTVDSPTAKLFTYMAVREDGVELFGFYTSEELRLFKMLITVSGVGPKAAISILSTASVTDLIKAIVTGNQKAISAAQGVGAKTAARVILELKDKLGGGEFDLTGTDDTVSAAITDTITAQSKTRDAENALLVLGYGKSEITAVLKTIDTQSLELEDIIKLALAKFMKK